MPNEQAPQNERDMEDFLEEAIGAYADEEDIGPLERIKTFRHAGIATHNKGLIVRWQDGTEYQITIVRSKQSKTIQDDDDESED